MTLKRKGVVFLTGPTASGKTDLALELATRFPCDLISVDSAMIYRGMDIGTAKPSLALRRQIPHRLIDICDPAEKYSASRFRSDALSLIEESLAADRLPVLVGGTMLYFRALERGLAPLPGANPDIRRALARLAMTHGPRALHLRLAQVDPESAGRIHPQDPQRIQRALEVYELTGRPMSELLSAATPQAFPYEVTKLVRCPVDRATLHDRIEMRFRQMLRAGFEEEVVALYNRGDLHADLPSMRSVGYRQMYAFLSGKSSFDQMVEAGIAATRQLAKRQLTWLRKETPAHWLFDGDQVLVRSKVLLEQALERNLARDPHPA